jgi:hypothetical protein
MSVNDANLLCAIRWPVTLITLGGLFALNNFTNYGFDRTWPVLLIVFGLMSLVGRSARSASVAGGGPGSPGVPR